MPCAVRLAGVVGNIDCARAADDRPLALGEPEVEQLGAALGQHDVAGLQVAVDDAGAMRLVERRRDLDRDLQRLVERQRALRQPVGQRLAFEVLHDEKRRALLLADVVERADVRMRELAIGAAFAVEPFAELRVGGQRVGEDLDRDGAVEARVARLVHLAHAARADRGGDLVGAEAGAGWRGAVERDCMGRG